MSFSLLGRSAVITGGSMGLGYEIAKEYVAAGANVVICGRDVQAVTVALDNLRSAAWNEQLVIGMAADVSKPGDAERIVNMTLEQCKGLHILVNNAGVYGPKGDLEQADWNDWVRAIEINLYGSVLMYRAALPHFKQKRYGKIIQLSGGGATNPLPALSAYAASKAAVVRLAETVAEEVRAYNIDVNSIAPGALNTRLLEEVLNAGPEKVGLPFYEKLLKQKKEGGTPLMKGAALAVFLGSAASDGITGKLLSAVWDDWRKLPHFADEMARSDVYTLRRIIPKDRGFDWGN